MLLSVISFPTEVGIKSDNSVCQVWSVSSSHLVAT